MKSARGCRVKTLLRLLLKDASSVSSDLKRENNEARKGTQMNQGNIKKTENPNPKGTDANRDPITGTPGAHPVGTGVGAAGGAAAGAAIGAVGGPVGAAVGLVVGAVAGGLAGKGVAEKIDPTVEDDYWRNNYSKQKYVEPKASYDTYRPAYRTGYEGYTRYPGKKFEEVESDLQRDYEQGKGDARLEWDKAKLATRDAWQRVENASSPEDTNKNCGCS